MALTYTPESKKTILPQFNLKTVNGESYSSEEFAKAKVGLVMFICNHCPYVQAIENRLIELGTFFKDHEVNVIGVCSNDPTDYPKDSLESLAKTWKEKNYSFVYLHDPDQIMAKDFNAVCTPDFFVYDFHNNPQGELSYRGRLDDSWRDASKVQKEELKTVILDLLDGKSISIEEKPSMGCSIKWKE